MTILRRDFLKMSGAAAAAMVTAGTLPAGANERVSASLIYNPETRLWEPYSKRRAYRYYRARGQVPEEFRRQIVPFKSREAPGTLVIDGNKHFLYLVMENQQAMRYGIGVGREGFGWNGIVNVGRTAEWPRWTPPAEMVARDPLAAKWAGGMPGGPNNPLGARALYLYKNGRDTIYRIHGTNEPWSIGLSLSSGCIRLVNDDIIDLHSRVSIGAKVIALMQGATYFEGV
ncbi:MAG: L,D-transpeptidase [Pseudomonadota bacterium]